MPSSDSAHIYIVCPARWLPHPPIRRSITKAKREGRISIAPYFLFRWAYLALFVLGGAVIHSADPAAIRATNNKRSKWGQWSFFAGASESWANSLWQTASRLLLLLLLIKKLMLSACPPVMLFQQQQDWKLYGQRMIEHIGVYTESSGVNRQGKTEDDAAPAARGQ